MPRQKIDINNKVNRVVALTSLTSDIVNYLSNDSLVGILGANLLKENNEFENKTTISSGRLPSELEEIVNLKFKLVLGLNGFHDKMLNNI